MSAHWTRRLKSIGACAEAVEWCRQYDSLESAWASCERIDWLEWLCAALGVETEELRRAHDAAMDEPSRAYAAALAEADRVYLAARAEASRAYLLALRALLPRIVAALAVRP